MRTYKLTKDQMEYLSPRLHVSRPSFADPLQALTGAGIRRSPDWQTSTSHCSPTPATTWTDLCSLSLRFFAFFATPFFHLPPSFFPCSPTSHLFVSSYQLHPRLRLLARPSPPQRRHRAQGTRRKGRGQGRKAAGNGGEEHPVRPNSSSLPVGREFAADPRRLMFWLTGSLKRKRRKQQGSKRWSEATGFF